MSQGFQSAWRRVRDSERVWLSGLVVAMEEVAHPARPTAASDIEALTALRAQLALPAQPHFVSSFSLRN